MFFRMKRALASVGVVTLAMGASVALGAGSSGAATVTPAAASSTVGVNGLCGGIVTGVTPSDLREGHSEANSLRIFRERLNYALTSSVPVDFTAVGLYNGKSPNTLPSPQPTLANGTHVNSYVIHSDPPGDSVRKRRAATIGFTSDVLGVQVLSGTLADAQSVQLRSTTTQYSNSFSGLEIEPTGLADYARLVDRRTVAVKLKTSGAVDEIRVITRATTSEQTALKGYRMLAADGGVFDFGGQPFYGSTGGTVLNKPVVAGVNTCSNAGYWFVASDGGVFSYGDAKFYGSLGGTTLRSPVVAMAATPTGAGYYLVTATGQVHIFGDAQVYNSPSGHHDLSYLSLNRPIVGMAVAPSGRGYWLVASDGGVFAFGDSHDVPFFGSTGNIRLVSPIIGMFAAIDGRGYYMYAADGGMFRFPAGSTSNPFFGSIGGAVRAHPVVGARLALNGQGYWFTDSAGVLFNFGPNATRATPVADMSGVTLFRPMIGMM